MAFTCVRNIISQAVIYRQSINNSVRSYGRWMHRKPSKVALPFEPEAKPSLKKEKIISLDPGILNKNASKPITGTTSSDSSIQKTTPPNCPPRDKSKEIKEKRNEKLKKRQFYLNQCKLFDDNNEFIYEKLKENDSRFSSLIVNLKNKKERQKSNQVLVEGWRLIVDGLEAKCRLQYIFFSRIEDLNNLRPFLPNTGVKLFKIPYKQIDLWSDLETSPGIFGVFEVPTPENVKMFSRPLPLRLICDNIRVPGNLGALLRVAVGAGCDKVLLTKGCVDLWDSKVIRSAAGAHFRLPIYNSIDWEEIPNLLEEDTAVLIADSNTDSEYEERLGLLQIPMLPYYGVEYSTLKNITLVIGGETEGISEESYRLALNKNGLRINIPLQRGVDSLNTGMAAAVIAFEIRKQLIQTWTKEKHERLGLNLNG